MEAESFFSRWAKRNAEAAEEKEKQIAAEQQRIEQLPPPTLEDVEKLTPESDFKRFVASGVSEDVRRSAMKKLFTDPHFNVMDGLDVYIEDFNKFEPIPEAMLAMLDHAKGVLDPLGQSGNPLMQLLQAEDDKDKAPAEEQAAAQDAPAAVPQPESAGQEADKTDEVDEAGEAVEKTIPVDRKPSKKFCKPV